MKAAERSGLLKEKSSRIAGRVSPALVEQAKKRTGIQADTDLIAFVLANVALEDEFAEAFKGPSFISCTVAHRRTDGARDARSIRDIHVVPSGQLSGPTDRISAATNRLNSLTKALSAGWR